jgi:hypothetical protein
MEHMNGPRALHVFRGLFLVAGYMPEGDAAEYWDMTRWMNSSEGAIICG